jgi:hypothetical protein
MVSLLECSDGQQLHEQRLHCLDFGKDPAPERFLVFCWKQHDRAIGILQLLWHESRKIVGG